MAETPLIACARAKEAKVPAGARYTMTIVYKYAPQSAVRAWHERRGPVPFCWPAVPLLVDITGRARSLVYDDLKALEKAGIIVSAQHVVNGQHQVGWELPLRDEETDMSSPPGDGQSSNSEVGQLRRPESDRPDAKASRTAVSSSGPPDRPAVPAGRESGPPDNRVRPAGHDSPAGRTPASGRPDHNSSYNSELNRNCNSIEDGEESVVNRETRARATPPAATPVVQVPTSRPMARRPVTLIDGEPAGSGLTSARELLVEIGQLFVPTDDAGHAITAQRIRPNDPAALVLAERLLAVPLEGLDEESAREARREQMRYVLDICHRFADLCRANKAKALHWRAGMLSLQVAAGKTLAAWTMIERDVAEAQRAAGEREAKAREAAQATTRTTTPSPQPEGLADSAADVAALLGGLGARMRYGAQPAPAARPAAPRAPSGATPPARARPVAEGDEERERNRGRWREGQAGRDEEGDLEMRRQMNAALLEARKAKGDMLTAAEADRIRQRFAPEGARA